MSTRRTCQQPHHSFKQLQSCSLLLRLTFLYLTRFRLCSHAGTLLTNFCLSVWLALSLTFWLGAGKSFYVVWNDARCVRKGLTKSRNSRRFNNDTDKFNFHYHYYLWFNNTKSVFWTHTWKSACNWPQHVTEAKIVYVSESYEFDPQYTPSKLCAYLMIMAAWVAGSGQATILACRVPFVVDKWDNFGSGEKIFFWNSQVWCATQHCYPAFWSVLHKEENVSQTKILIARNMLCHQWLHFIHELLTD